MVEGRGRADSIFLLCLFCLPAVMGERKRKKRVGLKGGGVWSGLRPQQMLIRRGGWFLDSYRPNQPSDEDRRSVKRLFIACFGVRKTA